MPFGETSGEGRHLPRACILFFRAYPHSCPPNVNDPITVDHRGSSPARYEWFSEHLLPHEPALRGYLRSHFPSVDVDDVIQESYLKIFRASSADTILSAKAYFFSIARHTALAIFRRRRIFSDTPVSELAEHHVTDGTADSAASAGQRFRLELAVEAIDQLPRRCREIFQLAALERMPVPEIAARLGITESTVYVQLARGVRKCADYLRKKGESP